jgi:hypothetical protein
MAENDFVESCEFPAPYVRVRGRVSRKWEVQWSPSIRTFKRGRQEEVDNPARPADVQPNAAGAATEAVAVVVKPVFTVRCLDYRGETLVSTITEPSFFAKDQEWATFVARLPYHPQTQTVVLVVNERVLGRLEVPTDRPYFTLLHPNEDDFIDPDGVLHLHWADHECKEQLTYFVRYSHNGDDWLRPGVNLQCNDFYLDLREMPGGPRCVGQVIATNGYRTSYVQTRRFDVKEKAPEVLLGPTQGPVLFAQGFSRQHGPITGEGMTWLSEDGIEVGRGGSLDIRTLQAGRHRISLAVRDKGGLERAEFVGLYDPAVGKVFAPNISL